MTENERTLLLVVARVLRSVIRGADASEFQDDLPAALDAALKPFQTVIIDETAK